jgi:hypothetical protein
VTFVKRVPETLSAEAMRAIGKECGQHYGYFVWVVPKCGASGSLGWIAAVGNGGQLILGGARARPSGCRNSWSLR